MPGPELADLIPRGFYRLNLYIIRQKKELAQVEVCFEHKGNLLSWWKFKLKFNESMSKVVWNLKFSWKQISLINAEGKLNLSKFYRKKNIFHTFLKTNNRLDKKIKHNKFITKLCGI